MGYWKQKQIEEFDRGFKYLGEKFVCDDCIGNDYIKNYIKEYASHKFCSYCDRNEDINISVHLEEVLEIIMDGIKAEYDDPRNCMGFEGGWQGAKTYDTFDLMDIYGYELGIEDDKLREDIIDSMIDDEWCEISPYSQRENEMYFSNWAEFCEIVKHKMRYMFLIKQLNRREIFKTSNETLIIQKKVNPTINDFSEILFYIEDNIKEIDIIKEIEEGSIFYRGRTHGADERYYNASDIGTPPIGAAIYSNRMSPAGIPMFYGGMDIDTVYEEMKKDNKPCVTIGNFISIVPFTIIDFTKLPPIPTVFNPDTRHLRQPLMFFEDFIKDLSKPVTKDGREHIEYIPTQIITEYIRHIFKHYDDNNIDGIFYPSACKVGGICCVLFLENKDCTDNKSEKNKKLLLTHTSVRKYQMNE